MSEDWRNEPATEEQKHKLRFFGCTWDDGITAGQASEAIGECAKQFPDAEAAYQNSLPATEKQKEKLRFFGCTWNGDITVETASDALVECAREFPVKEAIWQLQKRKWVKIPGTFPVKAFEQLDKTSSQEVTIQRAETAAAQPSARHEGFFSGPPEQNPDDCGPAKPEQLSELRSYGIPAGPGLRFAEARVLIESCRSMDKKSRNDTPDKEEPKAPIYLEYPTEPSSRVFSQLSLERLHSIWTIEIKQTENENRRRYDRYVAEMNHWNSQRNDGVKKQPVPFPEPPAKPQAADEKSAPTKPRGSEVGSSQNKKEWDEWIALHERLEKRQNPSGKTPSEEVTIQEAAKPQNLSPREIIPETPKNFRQSYEMFCPACDGQIEVPSGTVGKMRACPNCQAEITPVFFKKKSAKDFIPARVVPDYVQPLPAIRKPNTYKITSPIEQFTKWVDRLFEQNNTCLGGHWLPAGPLKYAFDQNTYLPFTIGLSRQIADAIESKGYCVEPDARFGSGSYEWDQTLALFKPLDGNPIQPSAAYVGAANLLRLCVLIATADGRVDLVELNAFRQSIETHAGLSLTDQKRLLILEQLLTQELCSSSKIVAKITKSVPADKRLVVGHLLVQVAAANKEITKNERKVLEQIFKAFEIPPDTLEKNINQIWPLPRCGKVWDDISKQDKWLWNHWRTSHPGVVIEDTTLAQKTWNFNDWKTLNARWRDLHYRLIARQKNYRPSSSASGEPIPKPIAAPTPEDFTLDMARVYEITSETKEVVAILSVLMEDEPEKSIAPSATITLPASEIRKVFSDTNAAPQPTRFNGLDAAFHPILERLLARDSWPKNDFKSLADEFHFMPSKIHDTLNEWSDEALGDFILDGEDPVVIRSELIAKEKSLWLKSNDGNVTQ